MHHWIIKKLTLVVLISLWAISPSLTWATSTATHHTTTKTHVSAVSKKTTKSTHSASRSAHHASAKTKKTTRKKKSHKAAPIPNDRTDVANIDITTEPPRSGFISSISERLVTFVHKTVNTLRYSTYKFGGTHFDTSRGVYVLDCSDYIDNVLAAVYPAAYFDLVHTSGSDKPTTQHYYEFFSTLDNGSKDYWSRIDNVEDLEAGDILVFRYKGIGMRRGGHVMVVMDKPIRDDDIFLVRVADSAPSGHSSDTRQGRVSGIGIGTLMLKANPKTGEPFAYAWKIGARWEKNVNFAMARPMNMT